MAPTTPPPPKQAVPTVRLFASSEQRRAQLDIRHARSAGFSDLYHGMLRLSWPRLALVVVAGFVLVNTAFACAYLWTGGIANARPGHFGDHFFFSVHTFGTIGYGSMYPQTTMAELVMTAEALVSLVMNAILCGLFFSRFARPTARVWWSERAVVSDRDGQPTLMFRVANERLNHVVEATVHVSIIRTERTREGERIRRIVDLPLVRDTTPSFILTWTVMHPLDPASPLYGVTPAQLAEQQAELLLTLTGLDETLGQTIHARYSYVPDELAWGQRFEDIILPPGPDGRSTLDYSRFHRTTPAPLTWERMGVSAPPAG